jgi:hypothetical protein
VSIFGDEHDRLDETVDLARAQSQIAALEKELADLKEANRLYGGNGAAAILEILALQTELAAFKDITALKRWTVERVLKKHNLWRELAGPDAGATALVLQWRDMHIERLTARCAVLEKALSYIIEHEHSRHPNVGRPADVARAALAPEVPPKRFPMTGAYAPEATCKHGVHPYDCRRGCDPHESLAPEVPK